MVEIINKNTLKVNDKILIFQNEIIRKHQVFDNLCIIIFDIINPLKNLYYNNVLAVDIRNETILWEIELNQDIDQQNPYMSVFDGTFYLIFQKSNDTRFAVNKISGNIIKNIDLNKGNRPW